MALSVPVNGVKEEGDREPLIELFVKCDKGGEADKFYFFCKK